MSHNRLYLVYRPTGHAIGLGKRMADGYYGVSDDLPQKLQQLFDAAYDAFQESGREFSQDDFCLAMEMAEHQPYVLTHGQWAWADEQHETPGILRMVIADEVAHCDKEMM